MWWNAMSTLQQVMFVIACSTTAVLLLQIIFMLVGGSSDADIPGGATDVDIPGGAGDIEIGGMSDAEIDVPSGGILDTADADITDGDVTLSEAADTNDVSGGSTMPFGFRLLSFRSIIAFLAVGTWLCYTLCYMLDWYWAVIISVAAGFAAACAMAAALLGIEKSQCNGNLNPNNAIGKLGTVYLTVPPARSGKGKVNVVIQERFAEYEAVTNGSYALKTASQIKVVGYAGNNVLIVEKYRQPSITIEDDGK